jgi:fatty-acyl-CoA synthase
MWFRSGDLGHLVKSLPEAEFPANPTPTDFYTGNATNSFIFLARMGDSLRLRGFLVDPSEIEGVLQKHPDVGFVQVVGVDLGIGKGEDAVAFVIPVEEARKKYASEVVGRELEKEVLEWARPRLANYKVPARVLLVDSFPVTNGPNGEKVQKAILRKDAVARLGVQTKL